MPSKICPLCLEEKDTTAFSNRRKSPDGLNAYCRDCNKAYQQKWYAANRDRHADSNRKWTQANAEKVRQRKRELYAADPTKAREKARRYLWRVKEEMVVAYGGKCECCGESHLQFLALHHRNGDGAEERRQLRAEGRNPGGTQFYALLRRQGWPKDRYGLLCHNCNVAISCYGACPHHEELAGHEQP